MWTGMCADGEAVTGLDGQVRKNGVREDDEDVIDEAIGVAENLGSVPRVALRVSWADVAQMKGPTGAEATWHVCRLGLAGSLW